MKIFQKIALGIVALLSLAAAVAKIMKAPQDAAFFEAVGLAPIFMTLLGILQLLAALIILIPSLRKIGSILAAISFFISAVMIFQTGQIGFALISLLPVALAIYVFVFSKNQKI